MYEISIPNVGDRKGLELQGNWVEIRKYSDLLNRTLIYVYNWSFCDDVLCMEQHVFC